MSKTPKPTLEDHKKYMDEEVQPYLKPLMVDILRKRPPNVPQFIIDWCQTKAPQVQKVLAPKPVVQPLAPPAQPPSQALPEEKIEEVAQQKLGQSIQEITQDHNELPTSDDENDGDFLPEQTPEQEHEEVQRKSNMRKKKAISAEVDAAGEDFNPPVIDKSPEQNEQIRKTLAINFMFGNLEPNEQDTVVKAMAIRNFEAGDVVIKQGDDGAELFIVGSGTLKCTQAQENVPEEVFLREYNVGDVFGELALMYNAPRAATITAVAPSECYVLDRGTFNKIVKASVIRKREKYEAFLEKIEILADLKPAEKAKIVDCLKTQRFKEGDQIITEGEEGDNFYLVQSGTAKATRKGQEGDDETVYEFKENDYFGELALITSEKRQATITVTSGEMVAATLDARSFSRLLGPIDNILKRNAERYNKFVKKD
jgi:cAMP-dependent protein kinase regulator